MIKLSRYTNGDNQNFELNEPLFKDAIQHAYFEFVKAKENVLKNIVEQIEKRTATIEDGRFFTLIRRAGSNKELVIYKDIEVGYIETDLVKMTVTFTPTQSQTHDKQSNTNRERWRRS